MPKTYDIQALLTELELDQETIMEILKEFRSFLIEAMPKLELAMSSGNLPETRSLSHTIKGSAGNMRVKAVYQTAYKMQTAADASDWATLKTLFEQLKIEAQEFLAETSSL